MRRAGFAIAHVGLVAAVAGLAIHRYAACGKFAVESVAVPASVQCLAPDNPANPGQWLPVRHR